MPAERQPWGIEPEKRQSEFEFVTKIARENLLDLGFHPPTIIVLGSRGATVAQFETISDTHQERMHTMFAVGRDIAQRVDLGKLEKVYMISEAWMSKRKPDDTIEQSPSKDPNRQEVLIISNIELQNGQKHHMALFEIIRDVNQRVCETREVEVPVQPGSEKIESPLLYAFVAGYQQSFSNLN